MSPVNQHHRLHLTLLNVVFILSATETIAQATSPTGQLFQGLIQTGYQMPIAYTDRLGPTLSAGLVFDEQVVYKFSYVPNLKNRFNQEHSFDILLSRYRQPKQWAIGAAYYKQADVKDIILPSLSFYNLKIRGSNWGYNMKVGFSLYAISWGLPISAPIAQFNLTYRIGYTVIK